MLGVVKLAAFKFAGNYATAIFVGVLVISLARLHSKL